MEEKEKKQAYIYLQAKKNFLKIIEILDCTHREKESKRRSVIRVSWYQLPDRCDLLSAVVQQFR